ncbi:MAG TPA: TrkA family potassium uptake protein [Acholeplasmataceae bacterium]|nr:TrkA family potassium uptake protein [Acholeplasmataceae bacterium]
MKKSIAVIGLSRFGLNLVEDFSKLNVDIIAIDHNKENVVKASEFVHNVIVADSTNIDALKEAGIGNVDSVIVAIGQNNPANLATSIITIIKLKQLGIIDITARADDKDSAEALKLVGATNIVLPLNIASERIAYKISSLDLVDYFNIKGDFSVAEIKVSKDFIKTAIIDLNIRNTYNLNILLIERKGSIIVPDKDTIIEPNDEVFVFGRRKDIPKISNLLT